MPFTARVRPFCLTVSASLADAIQQLEAKLADIEQRWQARMRVLEIKVAHIELQCGKRTCSLSYMAPPFTPTSEPSVSSKTSAADTLSTPMSRNVCTPNVRARSTSPDPFNPFDPIEEEDELASALKSGPESWPTAFNPFEAVTEHQNVKTDTSLPGAAAFSHAVLCPPVQERETKTFLEEGCAGLTEPASSLGLCAKDCVHSVSTENGIPSAPQQQSQEGSICSSVDACIELQKIVKQGPPAQVQAVFQLATSHLPALSMDSVGHYLVLRLLAHVPTLANHLLGHVSTLALSIHGVHVVEHLLNRDENTQRSVVMRLLYGPLKDLLNASHCLPLWRKVLSLSWCGSRPPLRQRILGALHGQWLSVINSEHGSALVNVLLSTKTLHESDDGIQALFSQFQECVCHPWGVWTAQYLLEHGSEELQSNISARLLRGITIYALSAYGSKALQCAQRCCPNEFQSKLASALLHHSAPARPGARPVTQRPLLVDMAAAQHGLPVITQVCGCV